MKHDGAATREGWCNVRIPKRLLAVAEIAATEQSRYAFHGVNVGRKGDRLSVCATDGRRLLKVEWTEQETAPLEGMEDAEKPVDGFNSIVPARTLRQLGRMIPPAPRGKKAKAQPPFVVLNEATANGHVSMIHVNKEFGQRIAVDAPSCDGQFPPYEDMIPNREIVKEDGAGGNAKAVRVAVNARLLTGLLEAMVAAVPADNETVIIEVPLNPTRPIKLTRDSGDVSSVGVLMPVVTT
jgi:hypothetical protein